MHAATANEPSLNACTGQADRQGRSEQSSQGDPGRVDGDADGDGQGEGEGRGCGTGEVGSAILSRRQSPPR